MKSPVAILTVGIPGSGKTTHAHDHAIFPGFAVVCRDDIRVELFGDVTHHGDESVVTETARTRLDECAGKGHSVVVADTNAVPHWRGQLVAQLSRMGFSPIIAHVFNVSAQTCLERNVSRDKPVPEDVIMRMEQSILEVPPLIGPPARGLFDDVYLVNQAGAYPLFPGGVGVGTSSIVSIRDGSLYVQR